MDPRRLEEWVTTHRSLGETPDGPLKQGSSFEQELRMAGRSFGVRWTVTRLEEARLAEWEGDGPAGSEAWVRYELREQDGSTRFDYVNRFQLPGGPLGRAAGRLVAERPARREAERSLQNLKGLIEKG